MNDNSPNGKSGLKHRKLGKSSASPDSEPPILSQKKESKISDDILKIKSGGTSSIFNLTSVAISALFFLALFAIIFPNNEWIQSALDRAPRSLRHRLRLRDLGTTPPDGPGNNFGGSSGVGYGANFLNISNTPAGSTQQSSVSTPFIDAFNSFAGFFEGGIHTGEEVRRLLFACSALPANPIAQYSLYSIGVNELNSTLSLGGIPGIGDAIFSNGGHPESLSLGFCVAINSDAFMLGIFPGFPPAFLQPDTLVIKPSLLGIGWSKTGNLVYNQTSPPLAIWDGTYTRLWTPQGNFWLRMSFQLGKSFQIKATLPFTEKTIAFDLVFTASLFGGFTDSNQNLFLNLEKATMNLAIIPAITLGSGVGGYRLNAHNAEGDRNEICSPSGIYFNTVREASVLILSDIVNKYMKTSAPSVFSRVDLGVQFRSDQFNGILYREWVHLSVLGIELYDIRLEFQYISTVEHARRIAFAKPENQCCVSYDNGVCSQVIDGSNVVRPIDKWLLAQESGDYLLVYAEATQNIPFLQGLVAVDNAIFILSLEVTGNNAYYLVIGGEVSVLFVVRFGTYVIVDNSKTSFTIYVTVADLKCTIEAEGDTEGYYQDLSPSVTKRDVPNFLHTMFSVSVSLDWGPIIGSVIDFAKTAINSIAQFATTAWNAIETQVIQIGNEIAAFFAPGGTLNKILQSIGDSIVNLANDIANAVVGVVNKIADFLKNKWNDLVNAGNALARGDFSGFGHAVGSFLGLLVTENNEEIPYTINGIQQFDQYGCPLRQQTWEECVHFIFSFDCDRKYSDPYSDQNCLTRLAADAHTVSVKADEQSRKDSVRANNMAVNQGLLYATNPMNDIPPPMIQPTNHSTDTAAGSNAVLLNVDIQANILDKNTPNLLPPAPIPFSYVFDMSSDSGFQTSVQGAIDQLKSTVTTGIQGGNNGVDASVRNEIRTLFTPAILPPSSKTFSCTADLFSSRDVTYAALGTPTIVSVDPQCALNPPHMFGLTYVGMPELGVCGGTGVKFSWSYRDGCGQVSPVVTQMVYINPLPPKLSYKPPDVTISCEQSITDFTLVGFANATSGCPNSGTRVQYTDSPIINTGCGTWTLLRTWTASTTGCPNDSTQMDTYVQTIHIVDNIAPYWNDASFPVDTTVDFLAPYGTNKLGFPTAYDSCGASPVTITYIDQVTSVSPSCAAERVITRTFTAQDSCRNIASRSQTITFLNTNRIIGAAWPWHVYSSSEITMASGHIEGQTASINSITAAFSTFGDGTCIYGDKTLTSTGPITQNGNQYYNGNVTIHDKYLINADLSLKSFSSTINTTIQTNAGNNLNIGTSQMTCLNGALKTQTDVNSLLAIPNYISSVCTNSGNKAFTLGAVAQTSTSITFTSNELVYNFFTIPSSLLKNPTLTFVFNIPANSLMIVNVIGDGTTNLLFNSIILGNAIPQNILWNFVTSSHLTNKPGFTPTEWYGTILAPYAHFTIGPSFKLNGQLFVNGATVSLLQAFCAPFAGFHFCSDKKPFSVGTSTTVTTTSTDAASLPVSGATCTVVYQSSCGSVSTSYYQCVNSQWLEHSCPVGTKCYPDATNGYRCGY